MLQYEKELLFDKYGKFNRYDLINNKKRLLAIRFFGEEEVLLAHSLLDKIKEKYPAYFIAFGTYNEFIDLLADKNTADMIVSIPRGDTHFIVQELQNAKFDVIINFQTDFQSMEIMSKMNVPIKYGPYMLKNQPFKPGISFLLDNEKERMRRQISYEDIFKDIAGIND